MCVFQQTAVNTCTHTQSQVVAALTKAGVRDKVSLLACNAGGGVVRTAPYHEFTAEEDEFVRK